MKFAALCAAACLVTTVAARPGVAAMIATNSGIEVAPTDVATPSRGMTMREVKDKFGAPATQLGPVGAPPITRWEYPGFVVYFEGNHVIHAVVVGG
jgi:hypothetical protein